MNTTREPLRELGECGLPQALEVVGERWSLLIVRAAFNGLVHFEEFSGELGIARNILSNRLARLVDYGVLTRQRCQNDRRKVEYRLTAKGIDLLPALLALRQWGQRHGENLSPYLLLVDARDRRPVQPIRVHAHDGRVLGWCDLAWAEPNGAEPNGAEPNGAEPNGAEPGGS